MFVEKIIEKELKVIVDKRVLIEVEKIYEVKINRTVFVEKIIEVLVQVETQMDSYC